MDAIVGLFFSMVASFVGVVLLLTFDQTREWVGLGNTERTGLPAFLHNLMFGVPEAAAAAEG